MDLIRIDNREDPKLESDGFPFKLFFIKNSETPAHWHDHSEIFFLKKGDCNVYVNGVIWECVQGDIIFIPPGSLHSYIVDKTAEYYAMVVGSPLFDSMKGDKHINQIVTPFITNTVQTPLYIEHNNPNYHGLRELLASVILESNTRAIGFELSIKMNICQFFTEIKRFIPLIQKPLSIKENMTAITMKKVLEFTSIHYDNKITISEMAKISNMSNQHFCRLFRSYTGVTFINFLTDLRLEKADALLKNTDLPITAIPELTGFCNSNYFARIYKNRYMYPPSFTRKKYRKTEL